SPDYNGHWGVRELCDICPAIQRQRCADDHREPTPADMDAVLAHLGYTTDYLIEDGHVWTHGLGEQRRYAIQHTLPHHTWELDQPHYLHAHGRSPHGHPADPGQVAAPRRHPPALRKRRALRGRLTRRHNARSHGRSRQAWKTRHGGAGRWR